MSVRLLFPSPMILVVVAAVPLAVFGCASQGYRVQNVIYEYTDQDRLAAERHALQEAQDECYFAGDVYAQLVGPPQIVGVGGPAGTHFRATQSFYCIGMRGEG
jgi:hypothetical protein